MIHTMLNNAPARGKAAVAMTRRRVLGGAAALAFGAAVVPASAFAMNADEAKALVEKAVAEINTVIASGKSEAQMIPIFKNIFEKYADVNIIARTCLGPDARSLSDAQMKAYVDAFSGYMARKYGKQFRELIGGQIKVNSSRPVKSWFEVDASADLKGKKPFDVKFLVSDRSGSDKFFDMFVEGISLRITERSEIGSMLDKNHGDINALIKELKTAG